MKSLLLPLCCFLVLGPQLRGALADETNTTSDQSPTTVGGSGTSIASPTFGSPTPATNPTHKTTTSTSTTTTTTTTTSRPATKRPFDFLSTSECRPVTLVAGGLIVACAVLLMSTLMLACRVCRLSRRLRRLSSSFDLVGSTDSCAVTSKPARPPSAAEAAETAVLLSDMGRTQGDLANGAPREEEEGGGRATEGGAAAEGEEKAAAGGGAGGEGEDKKEAPAAAASRPKEDVTASQSDVAAASSSEAAGEPKDVV